jgi:biopolymer transport protein ExbD
VLESVYEALEEGRLDEAIGAPPGPTDPVVRMVHHGLNHPHTSMEGALQVASGQELRGAGRFLGAMDTIVTLGPLLGLLGTVTGIMGSFTSIGSAELAVEKVTGGIGEALIATAAGLGHRHRDADPDELFPQPAGLAAVRPGGGRQQRAHPRRPQGHARHGRSAAGTSEPDPMKIRSPLPARRTRLEIIPLIDVMFFLLASFMMVSLTMTKQQTIGVNLPVAATSQKDFKPDMINLAVNAAGATSTSTRRRSACPTLQARLASGITASSRPHPVYISGDAETRHADMVRSARRGAARRVHQGRLQRALAVLAGEHLRAAAKLASLRDLAGQGAEAVRDRNSLVSEQNSTIEKANAELRRLAGERDDAIRRLNDRTREFNELVEKYNELAKRAR